MFDLCTTGDPAHYSNSCHTRFNMLTRVWQELEYLIVVCRAPWCTHRTSLAVKKKKSVFLWL